MIRSTHSLYPGNAVHLSLSPPEGSVSIRVLRRWDDAFQGPEDAQAHVVFSGSPRIGVVDWLGLVNGVTVHYRLYSLSGDGQWSASDSVSETPQAEYHPVSMDALDLVRERIELGLNAQLSASRLTHPDNRFHVLTAPPVFNNVRLPVVVVMLSEDAPAEHYIGEFMGTETLEDDIRDYHGWLSRVSLQAVAFSLNPDERRLLRRTLKDIVIANSTIMESAGLQNIDFSISDSEDFESHDAPLYIASGQFSCLAPSVVYDADPKIRVIESSAVVGGDS
jgi:hypothetical protein